MSCPVAPECSRSGKKLQSTPKWGPKPSSSCLQDAVPELSGFSAETQTTPSVSPYTSTEPWIKSPAKHRAGTAPRGRALGVTGCTTCKGRLLRN